MRKIREQKPGLVSVHRIHFARTLCDIYKISVDICSFSRDSATCDWCSKLYTGWIPQSSGSTIRYWNGSALVES